MFSTYDDWLQRAPGDPTPVTFDWRNDPLYPGDSCYYIEDQHYVKPDDTIIFFKNHYDTRVTDKRDIVDFEGEVIEAGQPYYVVEDEAVHEYDVDKYLKHYYGSPITLEKQEETK